MMKYFLFFISLLILSNCASDPNAPRFRMVLEPITGKVPDIPAHIAEAICLQEGQDAKNRAQHSYKNSNTSYKYETKCKTNNSSSYDINCTSTPVASTRSGFSYGMELSRIGNRAKRKAYAICLMKNGYVKREKCYLNCF